MALASAQIGIEQTPFQEQLTCLLYRLGRAVGEGGVALTDTTGSMYIRAGGVVERCCFA
jgi:hypothetical protein